MESFELEKPAGHSQQGGACVEDGLRSGGSASPLLERGAGGQVSAVCRAAIRELEGKKGEGGEGLLVHLTGTRFWLSIWIIADHFLPGAGAFVDRANVAVNLFIIMSGFVTQWAYGSRDLQHGRAIAQFYVRRIGRVLLPTYLSMFGAVLVLVTCLDKTVGLMHMLRCLCFLEPWREPEDWCPNGQTWTIAALLPSWLLYPAWKRLVASVEAQGGAAALLALLLGLWMVSFGPSLAVFAAGGGWITQRQHAFLYLWPPSQLADFAIGVATAALTRRHADAEPAALWRGHLADAALAIALAVAMAVPGSGNHRGWEPLYNHGLGLFLAAFLYGSCAAGGSGTAAALFSLKPTVWLGKYSFEVFLFQWPLYHFAEHLWLFWLKDYGVQKWHVAVVFMIALFTLSALYAELVEVPYVKWLKATTQSWVGQRSTN